MNVIWSDTAVSYAISIGFGLASVVLGVVTLLLLDHFLYRTIDFIEEIKKGNIAAAVFYSAQLLFIAIVIATAIS